MKNKRKYKDNLLLGIRGAFYYSFYKPKYFFRKGFEKNKIMPEIKIRIKDIEFKMNVKLGEGGISDDLFVCNVREYPNVIYFYDFLKRYRSDIKTIIDIGANIGYYVIFTKKILNKFRNKTIKIYAIEPIKKNFKLLEKNIEINKLENIKTINVAVGEGDKKIKMAVPRAGNLAHVADKVKTIEIAKNHIKQTVLMLSLKSLAKKYNFSKEKVLFRFDIEGYEHQLILGNRDFFKEIKKAHIIMEFHPFLLKKTESVEVLNVLKELGFNLEFLVTCYPTYFRCLPRSIRKFLKKTWVWEKEADPAGKINRVKNIDDLIKEVKNENGLLYTYPHPHLYLVKK